MSHCALLFTSGKWSHFHFPPWIFAFKSTPIFSLSHRVKLAGFSMGSEAGLAFFFCEVVENACRMKMSPLYANITQLMCEMRWAGPRRIKFPGNGFHLANLQGWTLLRCRALGKLSDRRSAIANRGMQPVTCACNGVIAAIWLKRPHMMLEIPAAMCRSGNKLVEARRCVRLLCVALGRESLSYVGKVKWASCAASVNTWWLL